MGEKREKEGENEWSTERKADGRELIVIKVDSGPTHADSPVSFLSCDLRFINDRYESI